MEPVIIPSDRLPGFFPGVLADVVLVLHFAVVAFVIAGLALIWLGNLRGWRWVNRRAWRIAHLGVIGAVAAQAWLGLTCPLTSVEMRLRQGAGGDAYQGSFIEHWLQRLLYYDAPPWVFLAGYSFFALVVAASWWYFPPSVQHRHREPA
jgi:hypothetical protein